ncbi:Digeranylgeranylglyceryl phosphate synthase [Thermoplasmatales archaeon]|nr:Digeranylgeranylglyceryl phosphate synthase [Thermoplasmatales archaeon]
MNPWIRIIRPVNGLMGLIATWISALIGVGYALPSHTAAILLASISVFMVTSAGNILNDILDHETDKINHPDRPIPSGQISIRSARIYAYSMFIAPIILVLPYTIIGVYSPFIPVIVIVAELLLISYETRTKNFGLSGNATVSILVGLIFIYGGMAVGAVASMVILFVLASLSNFSRELIKDIEDVKGDVDRMTFPRKHGEKTAASIASVSIIAAIVISPFPYLVGIFSYPYLAAVAVADIIFLMSIHKTVLSPGRNQKYSKIAMIIALAAFVIGGISANIVIPTSII